MITDNLIMITGLYKEIVLVRLWGELIVRNSYNAIPQVILCFVSFFLCYEMHAHNYWTLIPYAMVLTGCLVRNFSFLFHPKDSTPSLFLTITYCTSILTVSIGWAFIFYFIQRFYGPHSAQSVYGYILFAGQCSAGVTTFFARPFSYLFFLFPLSLGVIVSAYLFAPDFQVITGLVIFMNVFFLYQIRHSYLQLKKSLENELALTVERDKLQTLINAVPGFVSFIDKELHYRAINDFGKSFYKEDVIIGKTVGFLHPDSEFAHFVHDFMHGPRITHTKEIHIEFEDKSKTFIVSIQKIFDPFGGAVIVSVPMDELVEARENLKAQEAKSFYTSKLVSLGEVAAGIAHEINNPLAIIQGTSEQMEKMILRTEIETTRLLEYNTKIQKTVDRISRIIRSLKGLARNGESDPFINFNFKVILEPCIEVTRQRFRDEGVTLEILPYDPELEFLGQEIQISQVLMNLINNAFDAVIEGKDPRWIRIEVISHQEGIDIRVQDSGPGISQDIKEKIMEPFFTTKPVNKGTGLGLSISKNIMENHGGALIFDESLPHTTFIMRFKG